MEGVTTALVLFAFLCSWKPDLIRNRPQFYGAFAITIAVILLGGTRMLLAADAAPQRAIAGVIALLQAGAVALMFLSTGGQSLTQVSEEMRGAYEVLRRGEASKEVIIPLESQRKAREAAALKAAAAAPRERSAIEAEEAALDAAERGDGPPPSPARPAEPKLPLPLE